jgi:hypothetical protein
MKDTGGPAFPLPGELGLGLTPKEMRGMTLRDYFAAHATDDDICSAMDRIPKVETVRDLGNGHKVIERGYPPNIRQMARFMHADAMLAERSKE